MQEVFERLSFRAIAQLLADEILDGLDVVVGRGLDGFDALRIIEREVVNDVVEHVFHHRGQGPQFFDRGLIGQAL